MGPADHFRGSSLGVPENPIDKRAFLFGNIIFSFHPLNFRAVIIYSKKTPRITLDVCLVEKFIADFYRLY